MPGLLDSAGYGAAKCAAAPHRRRAVLGVWVGSETAWGDDLGTLVKARAQDADT